MVVGLERKQTRIPFMCGVYYDVRVSGLIIALRLRIRQKQHTIWRFKHDGVLKERRGLPFKNLERSLRVRRSRWGRETLPESGREASAESRLQSKFPEQRRELASYKLLRVAGSCTSDDLVQKSVPEKDHGGARHPKLRAVTQKTAS